MLFDNLLFILRLIFQIKTPTESSIVVETQFGLVEGYPDISRDSRTYFAFKGIPYSDPPIGNLRFQPPQPISRPWKGVLKAKHFPEPCLQYDELAKRHLGSEDCLFLNIFTPQVNGFNSGNKLPVIVFVHGGAFLYGNSKLYGPQLFMDEDVILITVHHRLGILGGLNTEDDVIKGNMGLKDVLQALKWINTEISNFGGDPSRVSLMGHSYGGVIASLIMLSKQSKGLISNVIIQSGSALMPWAFVKNPRRQAFRIGDALGCNTHNNDSLNLLNCLITIPSESFSKFHQEEGQFWSEKFGPSAEHPETEASRNESLITESPTDIMESGDYNKIPVVIGTVSSDGCLVASTIMENLDQINTNWSIMSGLLEIYNDTEGLEQIREEYFGDQRHFSVQDLDTFTSLSNDRHFFKGLEDFALYHLNSHPSSQLYLYYFDYKGKSETGNELGVGHLVRSKINNPNIPFELNLGLEEARLNVRKYLRFSVPDYGVCHADELKYLFHQSLTVNLKHYEFSKEYVRLWANFATFGEMVNWTPAQGNDRNDLMFYEISQSKRHRMIRNPFDLQRMQFWDKF